MNVYNIIWADDECDSLRRSESLRRLLDEKKIEVLSYAHTSEELKSAIESYKDMVDAVVVDGNFPRTCVDAVAPEDISGLIHTISFIELFNARRDIPFFLYTAKKPRIMEMCKNGELDYFKRYDRIVQKGELGELVGKIVNAVEKINSAEHFVSKKYHAVLNIADSIGEDCKKNLHSFLLDDACDFDFSKGKDSFNKLRVVLEKVLDECGEIGVIPNKLEHLSQFKFYCEYYFNDQRGFHCKNNDEPEYIYFPKKEVISPAFAMIIRNLIDILQDGSHGKKKMRVRVLKYVAESNSPYLFRACLYLVLDVLRWYKELTERIDNDEIRPPYYERKEKVGNMEEN